MQYLSYDEKQVLTKVHRAVYAILQHQSINNMYIPGPSFRLNLDFEEMNCFVKAIQKINKIEVFTN